MTKKLTHEEFMKKLLSKNERYANGDFYLIGKYLGSQDKILCHCNIHDYDWNAIPADLCRNRGCPICGKESSARNRSGSLEYFLQRLNNKGSDITLVGKYINMTTKTQFQCSKGHIWSTTPNYILYTPNGCPYCSGKYVWVGFNDLWTTREDIASLLKNPDDGYRYTQHSNQKVEFVCPDCNSLLVKTINDVSYRGLSCSVCSDGISYPNKFGRAFLKQLPLKQLKYEYQPDWAKPYFYDNYFEYNDTKYIVEMDGGFHYDEEVKYGVPLEERQRIDDIKTSLAIQTGVNIIRIECLVSDCDYIKNNIIHSDLNEIFNLSNINWSLCDMCAQTSLVKEACILYQSGIHKISEIAKKLNICYSTTSRYLQKGAKLGLCNYQIKTKDKM